MSVAGVMIIHDKDCPGHPAPPCLEHVVEQLAQWVDGLFFYAHDVTDPDVLAITKDHPKTVKYVDANHAWACARSIEAAWHLTDEYEPDWIVYPDSDETLPPFVDRLMKAADLLGAKAVTFPFVQAWDKMDQIVFDNPLSPWVPHSRMCRWLPNMKNLHHNTPAHAGTSEMMSPWPLLHFSYLTPELRKIRAGTPAYTAPPWDDPWLLMAFDDGATVPHNPHVTYRHLQYLEKEFRLEHLAFTEVMIEMLGVKED